MLVYCIIFFFQAEDGIRDRNVTGVQTCALPISRSSEAARRTSLRPVRPRGAARVPALAARHAHTGTRRREPSSRRRSEERRVGKECRSRWSTYDEKKKGKKEVIGSRLKNSRYVK